MFYADNSFIESFTSPLGFFIFNLPKILTTNGIIFSLVEKLSKIIFKANTNQALKYFTQSQATSKQHFGFEGSA
jgi:hypothetical protein